jgi:hypothetical protein
LPAVPVPAAAALLAVSLTGAVTAETVLPTAEVPPETTEFTGPAAEFTVLVAAEVTCETVPVTTGTAVPAVPLTPLTTPDNAEPSPPPEEL